MIENTEERKLRILVLAKRYADGYISLKDFYESELKENDDIRAHERKRLEEMLEEARRERLQREDPEVDPSGFNMTKEEFQNLPLNEQNKIYNEHPKEIRKLLGFWDDIELKVITREQFQSMSLQDRSKYFNKSPEQFKALLEGTVDSVDLRREIE